jgi:NusA N-terminal domain
MVHVDIAALRSIEREKEISFDTIIEALETALLTAYRHTPHSMPHARVTIDRKTGEVVVLAQEFGPEGELIEEYDDTPTDFGRVAAMTARQVIVQRLRDAEHDRTYGEYSGREGDIVTGVIQADAQAAARGVVVIDIGTIEAILPQSEQVPGEDYAHGTRLKCLVIGVQRGLRGPQVTVSRTHPGLVKKLFALEVPEIADGSGKAVTGARSQCGRRSPASTPRAPASGRWANGSATSWPSCTVRRSTSSISPRIQRCTSATRSHPQRSCRPRSSTRSSVRSGLSFRISSYRWLLAGKVRTRAWRPGSPDGASTSTVTPSRWIRSACLRRGRVPRRARATRPPARSRVIVAVDQWRHVVLPKPWFLN